MYKKLFVLQLLAQFFLLTHQSVVFNVSNSEHDKCNSNTIFIVDSSGSVKEVFKRQIEYIEKVIDQLNITHQSDHIALLVFSGKYYQKVKFSLNDKQQRDIVIQKVKTLPFYGGTTLIGMALDLVLEETKSQRPNVQTNTVVISDAFSFDNVTKQSESLRKLPNVQTFAVAIDKGLESEMLIMAGNKNRVFKGFDTYTKLAKSLQICVKRPQQKGVVTKNTNKNLCGQPPLSVKYRVKACDLNVVIIFDSSTSVRTRFVQQFKMLETLVSNLPTSPSHSHLSIIKLGGVNTTKVIVPLKNSLKNDEVVKKLSKLQYIGGVTYGKKSLQLALTEFQSNNNSNTPKVVIVFTDGYFQDDVLNDFKALQNANVLTYAAVIDGKYLVNRHYLEILTGSPSNCYTQNNISQLTNTVNALCQSNLDDSLTL